jgi:hypothetical protein
MEFFNWSAVSINHARACVTFGTIARVLDRTDRRRRSGQFNDELVCLRSTSGDDDSSASRRRSRPPLRRRSMIASQRP